MIVIFDLDGTLVNTITDLGMACNHALKTFGYPEHPIEEYPRLVGNGVNKLIERALPSEVSNTDRVLQLRVPFVEYYNAHLYDYSQPYEGIVKLLHSLQGNTLAVASNKYQEATERIVKHFFGDDTFAVIYGEREGTPRKPDPQIVKDILKDLPDDEKVFYVGDSLVDVHTARNAGVPIIACTWGFCPKSLLREAEPNYLVSTPEEIYSVLTSS